MRYLRSVSTVGKRRVQRAGVTFANGGTLGNRHGALVGRGPEVKGAILGGHTSTAFKRSERLFTSRCFGIAGLRHSEESRKRNHENAAGGSHSSRSYQLRWGSNADSVPEEEINKLRERKQRREERGC